MNNQERNRDALIEHIAEQDRIIRRRNEQIANQAQNAREDQKAIEELDARSNSLAADLAAAVVRADKAERERDHLATVLATTARQRDEADKRNPRPLTADDITYEMVKRAQREEERQRGDWTAPTAMRHILTAALTEPPTRPEGAEEIEAYMRELVASHPEDHYGELADHLASRGVLPPLTDKTHPEKEMNR